MKRIIFIAIVACMCLSAFSSRSQNRTASAAKAVNLELNKKYVVKDIEFTVQSVEIHKGGYPLGMFSGAPSNPQKDSSYDGVLGIELTLTKGNVETFSKLEKYLVNEKGERNVKEDMMGLSDAPKYTILFNVPMSARKIKFSIDNLELNLEQVLSDDKK
jgi:hypothetical protein